MGKKKDGGGKVKAVSCNLLTGAGPCFLDLQLEG